MVLAAVGWFSGSSRGQEGMEPKREVFAVLDRYMDCQDLLDEYGKATGDRKVDVSLGLISIYVRDPACFLPEDLEDTLLDAMAGGPTGTETVAAAEYLIRSGRANDVFAAYSGRMREQTIRTKPEDQVAAAHAEPAPGYPVSLAGDFAHRPSPIAHRPSPIDHPNQWDLALLDKLGALFPAETLGLIAEVAAAQWDTSGPMLLSSLTGSVSAAGHEPVLELLADLHGKVPAEGKADVERAACRLPPTADVSLVEDGILAAGRILLLADKPAASSVPAAYLSCAAVRATSTSGRNSMHGWSPRGEDPGGPAGSAAAPRVPRKQSGSSHTAAQSRVAVAESEGDGAVAGDGAAYAVDEYLLGAAATVLAEGTLSPVPEVQFASTLALGRLVVADAVAHGEVTLPTIVEMKKWTRTLAVARSWVFDLLDNSDGENLLTEAEQRDAYAATRILLDLDRNFTRMAAAEGRLDEYNAWAAALSPENTTMVHLATLLHSETPEKCREFEHSARIMTSALQLMPKSEVMQLIPAEKLEALASAAAETAAGTRLCATTEGGQDCTCSKAVEAAFEMLESMVRFDVGVQPLRDILNARLNERSSLARYHLVRGVWNEALAESGPSHAFSKLLAMASADPSLVLVRTFPELVNPWTPPAPGPQDPVFLARSNEGPGGILATPDLFARHNKLLSDFYAAAGVEHADDLRSFLKRVPYGVARRALADLGAAALDAQRPRDLLRRLAEDEAGVAAANARQASVDVHVKLAIEQKHLLERELAHRNESDFTDKLAKVYRWVRLFEIDEVVGLLTNSNMQFVAHALNLIADLAVFSDNAYGVLCYLASPDAVSIDVKIRQEAALHLADVKDARERQLRIHIETSFVR